MKVDDNIEVRKDFLGWKLVYPIKNEDGSINWKNLILGGSWYNFFKVILLVAFLLGTLWLYFKDLSVCMEAFRNPCNACMDIIG